MIFEFSTKCQKELLKIKQKETLFFRKIEKQLALFERQSDHPSLRLHKLIGAQSDVWSISIDMSVRMLFYYRNSGDQKIAVFFTIGRHEEVYK